MQRLRIRFSRGEETKFISHLDLTRLWQRALRRSGIPLAYSEGFNPHPRISLASPLAIGVTSESELMDIICTRWVSPQWFIDAVSQQLPPGMRVLQAYAIAPNQPSLQSLVSHAEYTVKVETDKTSEEIKSKLRALLSYQSLPWQHQRDTGTKSYDLRALIDDLWMIDCQAPYCTLGMKLRCGESGSGRPEQVTAALGFSHHPQSINRNRLILKTSKPDGEEGKKSRDPRTAGTELH